MSSTAGEPRLAPLRAPFEPAVAQALARWMPPGSDVEPLALFRTLVLHEQLAQRMRPLGAGILGGAAREAAPQREVMIDRTCALTGAEYEWGVHAAAFAHAVGLSEEQLRSTVRGGPDEDCWSAEQALVLRLADELHRDSAISQDLWDALERCFSAAQILELIATAGWYHLIAYICNGVRVALEPWAQRFPRG